MKLFILVALVAFAASASFSLNLDEQWERFKATFEKSYHPSEEGGRRLIWEQRFQNVIQHNLDADLGLHTYRKGINEYSDLSREEYVKTLTGYRRSNRTTRPVNVFIPPSITVLPMTVDWREKEYVTAVKNQKRCGSCWAFSATGSLEGQHKKKTGRLVSLSEQNLIDCSKSEGNDGCGGGNPDLAFEYVIINGGIDTEKSYPYTAKDRNCTFKSKSVGATCTDYKSVTSGDEDALQKAVATIGPISVSINASLSSFQEYKSGIYNDPDCSSESLNHSVLVIGYGTEDGQDYWLVKNSWGTSWGIDGFAKMSRNKDNQCGIASAATYPVV